MKKKTLIQKLKNMGPAAIIASAFIGPGTITTSTVSGTNYQYALLWTVVFSGIASSILMDISSRIAAYGGHSIIETTLGMSDSKEKLCKMVYGACNHIHRSWIYGGQ